MLQSATALQDVESRDSPVRVDFLRDMSDADWDAYVAAHCHGHHLQTSLWARVKVFSGWEVERVVVRKGAQVVAGAQLLVRDCGVLGRVGYVPKGPLLEGSSPLWANDVMRSLRDRAVELGLRVLFVQPADDQLLRLLRLPDWGFHPSPIETAPTATVVVDLRQDLDLLLARMSKGVRRGIRTSQERGVTVREGSANDIPTFHRLLQATGERKGFEAYSRDYYENMWATLHPHGHLRLFLSEVEGEAVSGQLVVPFRDTVVAKQIGWSGRHARAKPNAALDWATMRWAKEQGYRYYDLEGIEPDVARTLVEGGDLPRALVDTATGYKLRLGGEVRLFPSSYCFFPSRFLSQVYAHFGSRLAGCRIVQRAAGRFRTM